MRSIVVPFLNLFNGYTCPNCKNSVAENIEMCKECNSAMDWRSVDKPDLNKKYKVVNHCPEIHD